MPNVLIAGDTIRSPELRHEVPVAIGDPLIYLEHDGVRRAFVSSIELSRVSALDGLVVSSFEDIGLDDLIGRGLSDSEVEEELVLRACRVSQIEAVAVPRAFALALADHLRANGVDVVTDGELFADRRRQKTETELDGIRRVQRACESAMEAIRTALREREGVTAEELRASAFSAFNSAGILAPDPPIVSHGVQNLAGHEIGFGAVKAGEPIIVDLFPQDPESGCYADMSRTFCVGGIPEELLHYQALCAEALERACEAIAPGITGAELHRSACEFFEEHGFPTQLSKPEGVVLEEGFSHSLGHGVGLEVHEPPWLGRLGNDVLVPGDVVAVEPGLYRRGFGGCRLEDLVLVTEDGCEVIADYPYDLTP